MGSGDGLATAVGANALISLNNGNVGGAFYGLATMENDVGALTLGAYGAYATDFGDNTDVRAAAVLVGLEKPVSDRVHLMSENYVVLSFNESEIPIATLSGLRYVSGRVASDFAVGFAISDEGIAGPLPYIGLSYAF